MIVLKFDYSKPMKPEPGPGPGAEAIALAVKLSGHTRCFAAVQHVPLGGQDWQPCDGCLGDARTIDRELQLPQRNAAVLLAQAIVNDSTIVRFGRSNVATDLVEQLRDVLAAIK